VQFEKRATQNALFAIETRSPFVHTAAPFVHACVWLCSYRVCGSPIVRKCMSDYKGFSSYSCADLATYTSMGAIRTSLNIGVNYQNADFKVSISERSWHISLTMDELNLLYSLAHPPVPTRPTSCTHSPNLLHSPPPIDPRPPLKYSHSRSHTHARRLAWRSWSAILGATVGGI